MEVRAKVKFLKISPRKVRLVASLVRGMEAGKALDQLKFMNKKAAKPTFKLIASAIANAENNFELKKDNLIIKEIRVDEGPTLKRWMPRARGRATSIRKRTSHIELMLAEIKDSGAKQAKTQKLEAPIKLGAEPKKEDSVIVDKKSKAKVKAEKGEEAEKGKEIVDPRGLGKGKHTKIEGKSTKGFGSKFFRRKSG